MKWLLQPYIRLWEKTVMGDIYDINCNQVCNQ